MREQPASDCYLSASRCALSNARSDNLGFEAAQGPFLAVTKEQICELSSTEVATFHIVSLDGGKKPLSWI